MRRPVEAPVGGNRPPCDEKRPRDLGPGLGAVRTRRPQYDRYQEVTATIEEIFVTSRSEVDFRPPMPLKGKVSEKYKDKFCLYNNATGHTTATCFDLKDEIECLICQGKLAGCRKEANPRERYPPNREIEGEIRTIARGPYPGGRSQRSMKDYVREVRQGPSRGVFQVSRQSPSPPSEDRERSHVHRRGCQRRPIPVSRSLSRFCNDREPPCSPIPD